MQGDVRVESSPAGGARFVLTLPVLAEDGLSDEFGDELGDEMDHRSGGTPDSGGLA